MLPKCLDIDRNNQFEFADDELLKESSGSFVSVQSIAFATKVSYKKKNNKRDPPTFPKNQQKKQQNLDKITFGKGKIKREIVLLFLTIQEDYPKYFRNSIRFF